MGDEVSGGGAAEPLETVVAVLPTGEGGAPEYTRYFDTPQFWSNPPDAPPPATHSVVDEPADLLGEPQERKRRRPLGSGPVPGQGAVR